MLRYPKSNDVNETFKTKRFEICTNSDLSKKQAWK